MTKGRTGIPWSSSPSDSWEITESLILGMCASALDGGKYQSSYHSRLDGKLTLQFPRSKCPGKLSRLIGQHKIGVIHHSGYHFAHSTVWLMCAQTLAVFDISKHIENGVEITPELNPVGGTIMFVTDIILHCRMPVDNRPTFQSSSSVQMFDQAQISRS